ncbi:protein SMG9 [Calliphora vicina]|uniref:protein SMG9 n=1 Tax=Calliphora vicina TaxID=7373 RepID=UPI00325C1B6C
MSDRRRRYRKPKDDKRSMGLSSQFRELEVQPKILLKTKTEPRVDTEIASTSSYAHAEQHASVQMPQKTIIFQKGGQSPASSPNTTRETSGATNDIIIPPNIVEPVYQMTRPATVISSTGSINGGAKKLLMKSNTDFLVIGVVGTQGVGKSTILNLLANEQIEYNYYDKIFVEEDSIFPTKLKLNKCSARSRTESTHMFITSDRMILLDTPPVLSNAYKKDMTNNELEDLGSIICLMSVCHLLLVVQDDYFNLNFLNLLRFAELMKPPQDVKPFVHDYFPNILFVKNRAKRLDFTPASRAGQDQMYKAFFKDSQMRIYKGQTTENHVMQQQLLQMQNRKRNRIVEVETSINSFIMPEVKSPLATTYHDSLDDVIQQFRSLVFMTPRNPMYSGASELTEDMWFDLLTKVSQDNHNFFFNTYEDIQRKHLDVGVNEKSGGSGMNSGSSNSKDMVENWRE